MMWKTWACLKVRIRHHTPQISHPWEPQSAHICTSSGFLAMESKCLNRFRRAHTTSQSAIWVLLLTRHRHPRRIKPKFLKSRQELFPQTKTSRVSDNLSQMLWPRQGKSKVKSLNLETTRLLTLETLFRTTNNWSCLWKTNLCLKLRASSCLRENLSRTRKARKRTIW